MSVLQWSTSGSGRRIFREWPDEDQVIVYDTATGDTHLIEALGMDVLQVLEASPGTTAHLSHALADRFEASDHGAVVEYITATLHRLQDAGLVASTSL